jgi:hypothetical protein
VDVNLNQLLQDPENQPSQLGTVPLLTYEKMRGALEWAVRAMDSIDEPWSSNVEDCIEHCKDVLSNPFCSPQPTVPSPTNESP